MRIFGSSKTYILPRYEEKLTSCGDVGAGRSSG